MFLFKRKSPSYRSVLFVCTANVTRSPSAEAFFRQLSEQSPDDPIHGERWDVGSAGLKASKGSGPNPTIVFILHHRGISIANHRSQPIRPKLFKRYYWIIVMERTHREAIIDRYPDVAERVFVLREFGLNEPPPEPDMPDPTGKEIDDYKELFEILDEEIPRIFRVLQYRVDDLRWQEDG